jgi:hypothetical protein
MEPAIVYTAALAWRLVVWVYLYRRRRRRQR